MGTSAELCAPARVSFLASLSKAHILSLQMIVLTMKVLLLLRESFGIVCFLDRTYPLHVFYDTLVTWCLPSVSQRCCCSAREYPLHFVWLNQPEPCPARQRFPGSLSPPDSDTLSRSSAGGGSFFTGMVA